MSEVPLAVEGRGVAAGPQQLPERRLGVGDATRRRGEAGAEDAHAVWVGTREERRARGRADGLGGIEVREAHARGRQAVDVGRTVPARRAVGAHVGVPQVVGVHEDHVRGPSRRRFRCNRRRGGREGRRPRRSNTQSARSRGLFRSMLRILQRLGGARRGQPLLASRKQSLRRSALPSPRCSAGVCPVSGLPRLAAAPRRLELLEGPGLRVAGPRWRCPRAGRAPPGRRRRPRRSSTCRRDEDLQVPKDGPVAMPGALRPGAPVPMWTPPPTRTRRPARTAIRRSASDGSIVIT